MSQTKAQLVSGTTAQDLTVDNINTTSINSGQTSGRKNLIINGEMIICQRQGTNSTAVTNETEHVLDRFMVSTIQGGGTSLNVQQLHGNPTGAPYGFAASMKMTVAVTDDGGADSFNVVQTRIENLDSNYLAFGTSQAKTVTVSFYVKSSLTGTFGGSLVSGDFSRGYVFQYTISSADTWEKKTITIPADTTSTADSVYNRGTATSHRGLVLYFDLGSGSNAEKSAANSWSATGTWSYGHRIAGNVKLCANSGADWGITGIQLEEGNVATDFEHRSFAQELALCERYFYLVGSQARDGNVSYSLGLGALNTDSSAFIHFPFPTEMRATPTLDHTNGANYYRFFNNGGGANLDGSFSIWNATRVQSFASCTLDSNLTSGGAVFATFNDNSAQLGFTAEL
jgi:hypothetical protein